uniref:Uncharacterized protein n=1 Tax=Rhodopseudomonas palustris (strain DX-1) TaxID=652103 RepID=E6VFL3_RHOPX
MPPRRLVRQGVTADDLFLQPLGTSRSLELIRNGPLGPEKKGFKLIAEIDNSTHSAVIYDFGWLAQLRNGRYVVLQVNGSVRNIDQEAAEKSLRAMDTREVKKSPENGPEALAAAVKEWRGNIPLNRAAELLDIPLRTLEGIEQGRGFRYPRLLHLALASFGALGKPVE